MKELVWLLGVVLLLSVPGMAQKADPMEKALMDIEHNVWTAWANNDAKAITMYLTKDSRNLDSTTGGYIGVPEIQAWMAKKPCSGIKFDFTNVHVQHLDAYTAILTFTSTQSGTCDGQA